MRHLRIFAAEVLGTMILMIFGCISCVSINGVSASIPSAVTFGFTVATVICIIGHISSAHLNPAVTITFYLIGRIRLITVAVYLAAEIIGALLGMGVVVAVTPESWMDGLCVTQPDALVTAPQALLVEFIATFSLCLLVCGVTDPRAPQGDSGSLKFAAAVIAISLAAGKYTGASMNPARSLAPAVWTGIWSDHWVYWLGPITGSIAAPTMYNFFRSVNTLNSENEP